MRNSWLVPLIVRQPAINQHRAQRCWTQESRIRGKSGLKGVLGLKTNIQFQAVGPIVAAEKQHDFDPRAFLATIGNVVLFPKKQTIFAQGDLADAVFCVKTGKVRLTVVSKAGKEATTGLLGDGDFFGEGSLAGQAVRMGSATAMMDCTVLRIDKETMMEALHRKHEFSDMFVAYLVARNIRYEEDLVDHLFNSSEKRLARSLLVLAGFGKEGKPRGVVPKISQEMLAEMVGTTRSRVSFFMNRFRRLGFINYHAGDAVQVHSSLLNMVLHDRPIVFVKGGTRSTERILSATQFTARSINPARLSGTNFQLVALN
jgi:CRP/FNR family transcriptional regulator, cyclic AMP receptor protein